MKQYNFVHYDSSFITTVANIKQHYVLSIYLYLIDCSHGFLIMQVSRLLDLIFHSLYNHKEVFLRELVRHIQVLNMSTRRRVRQSVGPMTDSTSQPQLPQVTSDSTSKKTKTRGPTRCFDVWKKREGQRISISVNDLGQPICDNASKLTNFIGTLARNGEYAPLTFNDWRAVPNAKKDDMWGLVTSKFEFDGNAKAWVLKSIGKKWREWKGELKKLHYSSHEIDEERLADLDERVQEDQWKILVQFWNSEEGKARSKTNTKSRKKQLINHAAGSKSFARIREEETKLNEEISQQPGASQSSTIRNDLLSQVMGEDRHGRVRTYGLGPSPSDLWGTTSSQQRMASIAQRRDERYDELHADIVSLKENIAALSSLREAEMSSLKETMVEISSTRDAEISSLKETLMKLIATMNNANNNPPTVFGVAASSNMNQPSSLSRHWVTYRKRSTNKGKTTSCTSAGDMTGVSLTSIMKPGVTIAKGVVLSKDPLTKVGGHELGIGFWEVLIHVAIVRDEVLIRPYGRYKTIGDAIGTSIVWPSILCKV
ncbi:uncharacterized protein LOC131216938 isoform X2 [Magnolia sinica]|uniref:uncharacterized protein LOC131216938 isoform X2 n=1 Tax=Magnolia sinica TaxID=86752 RepID=UPI0026585C94|nr:uncharacterized protein LOC131216938 isoform X2 [Magnolia sinica]